MTATDVNKPSYPPFPIYISAFHCFHRTILTYTCPTRPPLLMVTINNNFHGAGGYKITLYICRSNSNPWQDTPTPLISPHNRHFTSTSHVLLNSYYIVTSLIPPDWNSRVKIHSNKLTFSSSGSWSPKSDAMLDLLQGLPLRLFSLSFSLYLT